MLILEGTDLVGKTTLAHRFQKHPLLLERGYVYKHFSKLPDGFNRFWGYVDNAVRYSVQDRFHMSEIMYSNLRGEDQSPLTPEMYRAVDGYLRQFGAFTVIVTASAPTITKRWGRDEMYSLPRVLKGRELFNEAFKQRRFGGYEIDIDWCLNTDTEIREETLNTIVQAYLRRQDCITDIAEHRRPSLFR